MENKGSLDKRRNQGSRLASPFIKQPSQVATGVPAGMGIAVVNVVVEDRSPGIGETVPRPWPDSSKLPSIYSIGAAIVGEILTAVGHFLGAMNL